MTRSNLFQEYSQSSFSPSPQSELIAYIQSCSEFFKQTLIHVDLVHSFLKKIFNQILICSFKKHFYFIFQKCKIFVPVIRGLSFKLSLFK